jgi:hypothetical protein
MTIINSLGPTVRLVSTLHHCRLPCMENPLEGVGVRRRERAPEIISFLRFFGLFLSFVGPLPAGRRTHRIILIQNSRSALLGI